MSFALRPYQVDTVSAIRQAWQDVDSVLIELATGLGKTEVFTEIARTWEQGRVLVVCPMIELISQAAKKILKRTGIMPDIEQGENRANESEWGRNAYVVASKQSLCSGKRKGAERFKRFKDIGLVIIDEAHLSITEEYKSLLDHFREMGAKVLGVTATAKRHDKRAMGQQYQTCAAQYGICDAVPDGWLVSAVADCVQLKTLDLSDVAIKQTVHGRDFDQKALNDKLETTETVYEIAEVTARESGTMKTVVYCSSVDEAKLVAERLIDNYKIKADWVCGDKKRCTDQRRGEVLTSFTQDPDGIQIVCNVGVLTTGWDFPGLQHIVMARPTRSLSLYTQIFGRGTRPLEGVVDFPDSTPELRRAAIAASLKPHFRVTDLVDASMEHKIVTSLDVLGGNYELPVLERAKADALTKGPMELDAALLAAQRAIEEEREEAERKRRAQVHASADYAKVRVDPFNQHDRMVGGKAKERKGIVMPWGKHKGQPLAELATGYMLYALDNWQMKDYLRSAMQREVESRNRPASSRVDDVNRLLMEARYASNESGQHHRQHHPRRGG